MTKNKVIEEAIEKAVKNGWDCPYLKDKHFLKVIKVHYEAIIFDISFAIAFFGKGCEACSRCGGIDLYKNGLNQTCCNFCDKPVDTVQAENWVHHIQGLALSEDRIEYIKKFL